MLSIIEAYNIALEKKCSDIIFGVRPSDIYDSDEIPSRVRASDVLEIEPKICELMGNSYYVHSEFCGKEFISELPSYKKISVKENVKVVFDLNKCHVFDKATKKIIF